MGSRRSDPPRRMAGLGFEMAAGVGGFALLGYWIGGYYDRAALGIVIGAALGIIGGMYNLIRASLASSSTMTKPEETPEDEM